MTMYDDSKGSGRIDWALLERKRKKENKIVFSVIFTVLVAGAVLGSYQYVNAVNAAGMGAVPVESGYESPAGGQGAMDDDINRSTGLSDGGDIYRNVGFDSNGREDALEMEELNNSIKGIEGTDSEPMAVPPSTEEEGEGSRFPGYDYLNSETRPTEAWYENYVPQGEALSEMDFADPANAVGDIDGLTYEATDSDTDDNSGYGDGDNRSTDYTPLDNSVGPPVEVTEFVEDTGSITVLDVNELDNNGSNRSEEDYDPEKGLIKKTSANENLNKKDNGTAVSTDTESANPAVTNEKSAGGKKNNN